MNGEDLRDIRNYLNKTQKEFAAILEIGAPYISQMENGHRAVSNRVKMKLAKFFKITPAYLDTIKNYKKLLMHN